MAEKGSSSHTPMDSSSSVISPSKKRVSEFLSSCVEVKKRKSDIGMIVARKEGEKRRLEEQRDKMQAKMRKLMQDLHAKEVQIQAVEAELQTLHAEMEDAS